MVVRALSRRRDKSSEYCSSMMRSGLESIYLGFTILYVFGRIILGEMKI